MYHQGLGFFLERRVLLKSLSSAVTLLLAWLWAYPLAASAQVEKRRVGSAPIVRPSNEVALAQMLKQVESMLAQMESGRAGAEEARVDMSKLKSLRERLTQRHRKALRDFADVEQHLKDYGLPDVMRQRHEEAVAKYETEMKTLMKHLDAIAVAPTEAKRHAMCQRALSHLRSTNPSVRHRAFRVRILMPPSKTRGTR